MNHASMILNPNILAQILGMVCQYGLLEIYWHANVHFHEVWDDGGEQAKENKPKTTSKGKESCVMCLSIIHKKTSVSSSDHLLCLRTAFEPT